MHGIVKTLVLQYCRKNTPESYKRSLTFGINANTVMHMKRNKMPSQCVHNVLY